MLAAPANAEPSVSAVEKQIDDAWNKIEPVIEQHNAIKQQLAVKKKKVAELNGRIEPLALKVELAMNQVSAFAVQRYKGTDAAAFNALVSGSSPQVFADQLEMLDLFAKHQRQRVQSVTDLKARYTAQKAPLDRLVAQMSQTEVQLTQRQKQINSEIKRLQQLRLKLYGSGGGGVGELRPAPCPYNYPGGEGSTAAKFACKQIGKTYVWGAAGPNNYDCSGLTMAAWAAAGVSLPHNAAAQRRSIRSVSRANLSVGDLVFYYSDVHHVGIYVGGGWIVHASRAGEPIRMKKVDDGPIHSYGRPG